VASSNKVKTAWKIIEGNSGNSYHDDIITKINCGNMSLENPKEIANAFNKYYTNIITNLNIKYSDTCKALELLNNLKLENIVQMEIIPVSEAEVVNNKILKSKNTAGYDGISSKILKQCAHTIIKLLTHIFNISLTTGVFPERCKFAIVRPIYKKGGHKEMNSYRPISLLTST
jgi:hypothetical protein